MSAHPLTTAGPAWLFCPADRPDRFNKAAERADVVLLDLEDGVAPADRPRARDALCTQLLDPSRTVVRINPVGTADHLADLAAVAATPYRTVMLAKTASAEDVATVIAGAGASLSVVALCETPAGVLAAGEIAAVPGVVALMWGAEDLIAGLSGRSSRSASGRYRDVARTARAMVLLAAGAHGKLALDAVHLDITDLEGLREEAEDAAASGFTATACIHPAQVAVVRSAYRPGAAEVEWAHRVLAAAVGGPGVFAFEGRMIDEPVLQQARHLLAREI